MKKEMFFVYVLDVTEHERGWGMRPDGYVCFVDGEVAHQWRLERYKDRNTNSVPECYDTYENGRWEPVHESIHTKFQRQLIGCVLKITSEEIAVKCPQRTF